MGIWKFDRVVIKFYFVLLQKLIFSNSKKKKNYKS